MGVLPEKAEPSRMSRARQLRLATGCEKCQGEGSREPSPCTVAYDKTAAMLITSKYLALETCFSGA